MDGAESATKGGERGLVLYDVVVVVVVVVGVVCGVIVVERGSDALLNTCWKRAHSKAAEAEGA